MVDSGLASGAGATRLAGWLLVAVAILTGAAFSYWMTTPNIDSDPHGAARAATDALGQTSNWLYIVALIALIFAFQAIHRRLVEAGEGGLGQVGLLFGIAGISVLLVALCGSGLGSVVAGKLYLGGNDGALAVFKQLTGGSFGTPILQAYVVALILALVGTVAFSAAIWRSQLMPRWVAVVFGLGVALMAISVPVVTQAGDILLLIAGIRLARLSAPGARSVQVARRAA